MGELIIDYIILWMIYDDMSQIYLPNLKRSDGFTIGNLELNIETPINGYKN